MKSPRLTFRRLTLVPLIVGSLLLAAPAATAQPNAAKQIVFSGIAFDNSTFANNSPAGFWIWCEDANAGNPYAGRCNGAMYFYALGITKGVFGTVSESAGIFTMSVQSADGSVDCDLSNASASLLRGPRNEVDVTCAAPSGSATSSNAVVVVTGP